MKKSESFSAAVTFSVLTAIAITLARYMYLSGDHAGLVLMAIASVAFGIPSCAFTYLWANPGEYVEEPDTQCLGSEAEAEPADKHWLRRPEKLLAAYQFFK